MRACLVVAAVGILSCGGTGAPPQLAPVPAASQQPATSPLDTPVAESDAGAAAAAPTAETPPPGLPVTVLVKDLRGPNALAVDKGSVYWVDELDGDLARVPKRGGITMTVVPGNGTPFSLPSSVAVDDSDVYFTSQIDRTSSLARQDKNGGKPTIVASSTVAALGCVVVDESHIYWVGGGAIMRAPKSGGPPASVAGGQKGADCVAVDDKNVYWSSGGSENAKFADGAIVVSTKSGANVRVLVKGAEHAANVHVDDKNVYWQAGDKVMKSPKSNERNGGATMLAQAPGPVADIALDDASVYFAFSTGVGRVPKEGGTAEVLTTGQANPTSIGVDSASVYFTTKGTEAASGMTARCARWRKSSEARTGTGGDRRAEGSRASAAAARLPVRTSTPYPADGVRHVVPARGVIDEALVDGQPLLEGLETG